ncbi:pseudouridine synthase [Aquicoccus porphyridii]|uniref:pseudouridine synthase n=1 Tax=Aquicoccus porphyridii TaxID=1852029 RepID=UPI00273E1542|nr:pseudouridine synthase [Aquicoccus porphyridii]
MSQKPPQKAAPSGPQGDRIAKVIARAGLASRREAERMIEIGRVAVNGQVITRAALNVTEKDSITVDGKPLDAPAPTRLWLYHKPTGLVTTTKDEQGRPTIFDDLPADLPRVLSVGRLDLNSEGLLLLTNDGAIKRRLELPSTGWLRRYRVRVNGRPTEATFEPLRQGLSIDGESFQPMVVTLDRQQGANAWVTVALREGKNRELRRAMEAVGLSVNRLIRISYGPFQLGQLKPGEVQEVRGRVLRDQLGLEEVETPPDPKAPKAPKAKAGTKPGARSGPGSKSGSKPASRPGAKPVPQRRRKPRRD